jgi:exonuclease SbcC
LLAQGLAEIGLSAEEIEVLFALPMAQFDTLRSRISGLDQRIAEALSVSAARQGDLDQHLASNPPELGPEDLRKQLAEIDQTLEQNAQRKGAIRQQLSKDDQDRGQVRDLDQQITAAAQTMLVWQAVRDAIGSQNGDLFARIAQSVTLDELVETANQHLATIKPRYRLKRSASELALSVIDLDIGDSERSARSLSGGERFLVSLSLALALSGMGGKHRLASTLFIDEGFGSLDGDSLEIALEALEALQSQGRTVGVISHVEALKERIPVQIQVQRQGNGKSKVVIKGPAWA